MEKQEQELENKNREPVQPIPVESEDDTEQNAPPVKAPSSEVMRILEALLFATPEILPAVRLKTLLPDQPDARIIRKMISTINEHLQKERHPFEIVEVGGGYQFRTIPYYQPWVQQLFKERASRKLSIQALETLAIISYKQPITKAEVESIRGVVSDGAMKPLLEKRLVTIVGRSDKPGHPLLYGTTQTFLHYFGINRLDDLPKIEEFESIARKKMEELSEDELRSIEAMAGEEGEPSGEIPEAQPADDAVEHGFAQMVHENEIRPPEPAQGSGIENPPGAPRGNDEDNA